MNEYEKITVELWHDNGPRCGFRLSHADSSYNWSWYGRLEDFTRFLRDGGALADISYMSRMVFDLCEFFYLESNYRDHAKLDHYVCAEFPWQLRHRLADALELCAGIMATGIVHGQGYDRGQTLDLTDVIHAGCRYYGHGKGSVEIRYSSPEVEQKIKALRQTCEQFGEKFDRIVTIARNSTSNADEVGIAHIHSCRDREISWSAGSLAGGLINHGDEDGPNWSLHT